MKKNRLIQCIVILLPLLFFSLFSFAQTSLVKGSVTDEKSEPIPGVSVVIQGTTTGVVTDINGKYQINAGAKATLSFSFVGYKTQDILVENRKEINPQLLPGNLQGDEDIVVGYGTLKKNDVSGAVASVRSKSLKNLVTTDAAAALQGKASGVQVLNNSGAPGQGATIRVRGYSSNSANIGPLLIVDGLQVDNIQYLNPSMIASVEILKDAALLLLFMVPWQVTVSF